MVKIDLITGFLGSGKTTFIKKYAKYLISKGNNIGILENDYGAVNVDMMLLGDIMGDKCELEMIAGGCDYETHKRRFRTKLIAMRMSGYDRVIVEPSGIFDADEFFDVLYEEPLDTWYEIGSIITVVDAGIESELNFNSEYLLTSQLSKAGAVVMSKTAGINEDKLSAIINRLNSVMKKFKCERILKDEVITKNWNEFTDEDFEKLSKAGHQIYDYEKHFIDKKDYSSVYVIESGVTKEEIEEKAQKLFTGKAFGNVMRIKGFIKDGEKWEELNATPESFSLKPIDRGQDIIIVIGEELNENEIKLCIEK